MQYKLCVMGNPIEHSKSPWIHDQFAKQLKLTVSCIRVKPKAGDFNSAVEQFKNDHGHGFSITSPFKQEAYQIATERSQRAAIAKSVNTIKFCPNGVIYGDNTDGAGLVNDITQNLNYSLAGKTILILGAGGAVRGILHPLLSEAPAKIIIANRTVENAKKLVTEFSSFGSVDACAFDALKDTMVDVVIDGTLFNSEIPIPSSLSLSENSLCYDLKYDNNPTRFMKWAKIKKSKIIVDGLGMVVEQAAEAFFVWTGERPNTKPIIKRAKENLSLP